MDGSTAAGAGAIREGSDHGPDAARLVHGADTGVVAPAGHPDAGQAVPHPVQVVGVVGGEAQLDQSASGALDDAELLATVAVEIDAVAGQPERRVVATGLFDVRNADRDGGQSVQSHDVPLIRAFGSGSSSCRVPSILVVITSPPVRKLRRAAPTPSGVPVKDEVPGELSVRMPER